jgi:hypothetical protein
MSSDHKAALAKGREQARAVRSYLEALRSNRPKRGRKRTPASIEKRVGEIDAEYESASALRALNLLQERKDLEAELAVMKSADTRRDLEALKKGFVKHAKAYGSVKGIAYGTWRQIGVPADVLREAGIARSS